MTMQIKKVHIKEYGGLEDRSIEFKEGLNIIYGENERGKSTLISFITSALFGLSAGRPQNLRQNERKRYLPWDKNKGSGRLEVIFNGEPLIIERVFGATKAGDKTAIYHGVSGDPVQLTYPETPGRDFFKIGRETYEKTGLIGQLSSEIGEKNNEEIINYLVNLQATGDATVSYEKTKNRLVEYRKTLTNTKVKPGKLNKIEMEWDEKFQDLNKIKKGYEAYKYEKDTLEDTRLLTDLNENEPIVTMIHTTLNTLNRIERELEKDQEKATFLMAQDSQYKGLDFNEPINEKEMNDHITVVAKEETQIETYEKQLEEIEELEKELEALKVAEQRVDQTLGDVSLIEGKTKALHVIESLEGEKEALNQAKSKATEKELALKKLKQNKHLGAFMVILGLSQLALNLIVHNRIFLVTTLLFLGFSSAFILRYVNLSKKIDPQVSSLKEIEQSITAITQKIEAIYKEHGIRHKQGLEEQIEALDKALNQKRDLRFQYELKEKTVALKSKEKIEAAYKASKALKESILRKYHVSSLEALQQAFLNYVAHEKQVHSSGVQLKELEKDRLEKTREITQLKEDIHYQIGMFYENKIENLENDLNALAYEKDLLKNELAALDQAIEVLESAFQSFYNTFGSKLNEKAGQFLGEITHEKYETLKISRNFDVTLLDQASQSIKSIAYFSNGTFDQIYFAVRLALLEGLFEKTGVRPPVILDDAFIQYDEKRLGKTLEFLDFYSQGTQVFLFTCRKLGETYPSIELS